MNSATSGIYAALGAARVGPGDEVIVSPYTMSASATAPLVWGALPIFADIDDETFCLSPESVRSCITARTRAIIAVDLFGHPAPMDELMALAREHDLVLIEDAAQAPGATLGARYAGTLGHIGIFSLNYHKVIHCGEGGVVVTDDSDLAGRVELIRNHAEAVVGDKGVSDLVNMVGFNFRMTEIEAAIASEQLKKLDGLLSPRRAGADYLTAHLSNTPGLTPPVVRDGVAHSYYVYALRYDETAFGVPRAAFAAAVRAEGLPVTEGYVRPLYLEPAYQERMAIGRDGFPFSSAGSHVEYTAGRCPTAERLYRRELLYTDICHAGVATRDLDDAIAAITKVVNRAADLRAPP